MSEITEVAPAKKYEAAPGTEILVDEDQNGYTHTLQHLKKGDGHVLLVPQPSLTDVNDPLRWPAWKKWMVYINGLTYSFLGSNIGPLMSGGMVEQSQYFKIPISHLSWAAGMSLLMGGVACLFWIPFSVKYGRRPVFLASAFTSALGCIWCGVAAKTTFASFFVGRAFAGFASGPIEAIVPTTITDIFFLHDRGEKISIYGLSVLGGNEIGPIISAYVIMNLSMSWAFYIVAIALFLNFLTIFFTMPETAYYGPRPSMTMPLNVDDIMSAPSEKEGAKIGDSPASELSTEVSRKNYIQELKPWGAVNPDITLRKSFLRPFVLIAYPTVLWASLVYGMALTWNVILALSVAQLFAPPPYHFNNGALGLIFLAPTVGSLVGTYLCGPLADKVAMAFTRRNNGIREPEMRLPIALLAALLTFGGVAIAGPCYHYQTHWIGPIFGFGVLSIGSQMGANLSMTYALDSHKELSGELMVTVSVIKSCFAWAWSWFINEWIIDMGMMNVFFTVAALNFAVYATTIAMYYKGKAIRIWIRDQDMFAKTGLA